MFRFLSFFFCAFAVSTAGLVKHHNIVVDHGNDGHGSKDTHGAELTSLAHNSAIQAKNALQNQHTAGSHAAYGVKNSLASAALGAAQSAQAAAVGKQAILGNLKHQLSEAEQQLKGELALYQQTQNAAHTAQESAQKAQTQLTTLTAAMAAAQAGAHHAHHAAAEAANTEAVQHNMMTEAKNRVAHLSAQVKSAHDDLLETQASAAKAAEAAHIAQSNAASAGAAVAAIGHKASHSGGHH